MTGTRRCFLTAIATAWAASRLAEAKTRRRWNPKLGVLGRFTDLNIDFIKQEGFRSVALWAEPKTSLDAAAITDERVEHVKQSVRGAGLSLSAVSTIQNHVAPDLTVRNTANTYFTKVIELAGKLGAPYVGTSSGTLPGKALSIQVDEIVRVYTEKYFPLCEKQGVRILWEPWAGGPNIATGPIGYEALFKAFGACPYVGLQYDPSHLVWQMMDPIQCARDFADKIFDVHLKDTEILWPVVRRGGIQPVNHNAWWRFRLPGLGSIDWVAFFTVLMEAGYEGAMNIEHEDELYGWPCKGDEFSEAYKTGFRMAHRYLRQFVPE